MLDETRMDIFLSFLSHPCMYRSGNIRVWRLRFSVVERSLYIYTHTHTRTQGIVESTT
jgi:hypothetical protein